MTDPHPEMPDEIYVRQGHYDLYTSQHGDGTKYTRADRLMIAVEALRTAQGYIPHLSGEIDRYVCGRKCPACEIKEALAKLEVEK